LCWNPEKRKRKKIRKGWAISSQTQEKRAAETQASSIPPVRSNLPRLPEKEKEGKKGEGKKLKRR